MMGRPIKEGIDYFPTDVDIFQDRKIKRLLRSNNGKGFTIYIYLLSCIYREKGYYYEWDKHSAFDISDDLNIAEETVTDVVNNCCEIGLFNQRLYKNESVLSSKSVQQRWKKVVEDAKRKNTFIMEEMDLTMEETTGLGEETNKLVEETTGLGEESAQSKEEDSKEEDSKEEDSNSPFSSAENKVPTWEDFWTHAESKGFHTDYARHLYDSRLSEGWKRSNGNPIEDWRAYLNMNHKYQRTFLQKLKQENNEAETREAKANKKSTPSILDRVKLD